MRRRKESGMKVCHSAFSNCLQSPVPDDFVLIVLREIEAEDSLWHQKKTAQSQSERSEEPKEEEKPSSQPTEEKGKDEAVKTATRKSRFY